MSEPIHPIVYQDTVPGGRYWSMVLKRGFTLRLTDLEGGANAGILLYNPHNLLERYNMADTLKGQHTQKLQRGHMLYSDMGRVMCSIIDEDLGWHDTIGGISDGERVRQQWGETRYQEARNDFYRSGRELFLIELGKWGLGERDLVPNLNLFSKLQVNEQGQLAFVRGHSHAGAYITLRAEMDTLVILQTAQHPLDPAASYSPKPVALAIQRAAPVGEDDLCRRLCPENERAFQNTAIYHCQG